MEIYSERNTCPKCGSAGSITQYRDDRFNADETENPTPSPYMARECISCGFRRKETPLDAASGHREARGIILPDNWNMYSSYVRPSGAYQVTGRYDKESKCPKCGNARLTGTESLDEIVDDDGHIFALSIPVIERECGRCGFVRYELPLDAIEEEVSASLKGSPMPRLDD